MSYLKFCTKAQTLQILHDHLKSAYILPQYSFTVSNYKQNKADVLRSVVESLGVQLMIVRSSAICEDTAAISNAGKYVSIMNVVSETLEAAVDSVIGSYDNNNPLNEVLIQPMLDKISCCGVIFSAEPNSGGNYYIINYDESGSTDSITSGSVDNAAVRYIFKGADCGEKRFDRLIQAVDEIISLFGFPAIDVEFAFDTNDCLFILQARPLVMNVPMCDLKRQAEILDRISGRIKEGMKPHPHCFGKKTIYANMSDWNPAEMIGTRPKPLALSLYKELITDGTWAYQRYDYGYKDLRGYPLLIDLCGIPYIDVRSSFNSFIPYDIDAGLGGKLVDYYLDALVSMPDKQDKVEFDIIFSCYTFDLPKRLELLDQYGFSHFEQEQLRESLLRLTNRIINADKGLWIDELKRIDILEQRRKEMLSSGLDVVSKIYWLMENCRRYGTLPFAGLARAGFIAVSILHSMVATGIFTENDYRNYMRSLNTISSQISSDLSDSKREAFLRKYGHLRPGTYDITSPRYDAAPEIYFNEQQTAANPVQVRGSVQTADTFSLRLDQYAKLQDTMHENGINCDVLSLFKFLKAGIEGREFSKFVFTHTLSDMLELYAQLGESFGFSRDDLAYSNCRVISSVYSTANSIEKEIRDSIKRGKECYENTLALNLPPVITRASDIYSFTLPDGIPNFITQGQAFAETAKEPLSRESIKDKILLIPAADPGYDWIFTGEISGFITAYGGANSHMAIRAGELGIPAVIGVGAKKFNSLLTAKKMRIDCANKEMQVIQ